MSVRHVNKRYPPHIGGIEMWPCAANSGATEPAPTPAGAEGRSGRVGTYRGCATPRG